MSEQAVDLRSTLSILRRNRRPLLGAATVGAAAGVCAALLWPPLYTSSSLVLLPPAQDGSGQAITRDVETTIRVASSEVVMAPAGKDLTPAVSARRLAKRVEVTAPTTDVIQIQARDETPQGAQTIARAVAKSEVRYATAASSSLTAAQQAALANRRKDLQSSLDRVNTEIDKTTARKMGEDPSSAQGKADAAALAQLTAQQANLVLQLDQVKSTAAGVKPTGGASIIQAASPAKRPGLIGRYVLSGFLGLLAAIALASVLVVSFARRDRRVRYRDQIADAVGSTVIASVRSHVPKTVAGWHTLLEGYDPGTVDTWALRQALRQLEAEEAATRPRRPGQAGAKVRHPLSITVVSLSNDQRGLAVGPQLAAYAASTGIRTRLVAAQGHESAASLWAACSGKDEVEIRPNLLVSTSHREQDDAELTILLAVLDHDHPQLQEVPETSVTVLALSPGTATAEDLARAAVTSDDAGMRITGVVVVDPDPLDRTTGRLLQRERSQQVPLPTRLTGMNTAASGAAGPAARGSTTRGSSGRNKSGRGNSGRSGGSGSRRRPG
jgi:capsular polysaccharide biosynthesis protein